MSKRSAFFAKFAGRACFAFLVLACSDQQPSGARPPAPSFGLQGAETTPTDQHVVVMNGGIPVAASRATGAVASWRAESSEPYVAPLAL